MTKPVLGLDFGTTKTVAAWITPDGIIKFAAVDDGVFELPSAASYQGTRGSTVLGNAARRLFSVDPKRTIVGVKRFLGRRFKSDFVQRNRQRFMFPLVEAEDGTTAVELRGEVVSLERVAARLVGEIVDCANRGLGDEGPFEACVVACPAHFHLRQRQALRRVVERCGLEVRAVILEPTAAAMTLPEPDSTRTLLVYDLGGGTFDTTVLKVEAGVVKVLAATGDAFLGGFDLDQRIVDELVQLYKNDSGIDLYENPVAMQTLLDAAENAKVALSDATETVVTVPFVDEKRGFMHLERKLTRADLEAITGPLVEKTIGIAQDALAEAGITRSEIDELVAVGTQTRMPFLRRRLEDVFGRSITPNVHPTHCVAVGAAVLGNGEQMLFDAVSMPVFAAFPGQAPSVLFAPGLRLPAKGSVPMGQAAAGVIYEAADALATDRDVVGRIVVPPEFRAAHPGACTLHGTVTAAFVLEFEIEAADGARTPVEMHDIGPEVSVDEGPQRQRVIFPEQGLLTSLSVLVRALPSGTPTTLRTLRIASTWVSLVGEAPAVGTTLELVFRHKRDLVTLEGTVSADRAESGAFTVAIKGADARQQLERLVASIAT